jgi:hypothetical protein
MLFSSGADAWPFVLHAITSTHPTVILGFNTLAELPCQDDRTAGTPCPDTIRIEKLEIEKISRVLSHHLQTLLIH